MLRILAPLVLALPALAQFPQLGLYAQRQRPPVLQLVQSSTHPIRQPEANARLLGGSTLPDTSSCRVLEAPAPWNEKRVLNPLDAVPTTIAVEACIPLDKEHLMEALGGFLPPTVTASGQAVEVQGAFDPSFGVPIFDVIVTLPDHTCVRMVPADGTDDFAGSSGGVDLQFNALLQHNEFNVAQFGAYFTQPGGFDVFLRARIVEDTLSIHTTGMNLHYSPVWMVAAGVVVFGDPQ